MRPLLSAFAFALLLPSLSQADGISDVGEITAEIDPIKAKPGQVVDLKFTITPTKRGWHTYPSSSGKVVVKPPPKEVPQDRILYVVGDVKDPPGAKVEFGSVESVYTKAATWTLKAVVSPSAKPGKQAISFEGFAVQICANTCLNANEGNFPKLSIEVENAKPEEVPAEYRAELKLLREGTKPPAAPKDPPHTGLIKKKHIPLAEYQAKLDKLLASLDKQEVKREGGLAALLLTAAFWGLVSLATPCVFPMIPITVSLFLKQSNQTAGGAAKLAGIYCGTIVVVLGLSAVFLLGLFRWLSVNPLMNLALGALFIVFALSLLGMYNLTLPNFLLRAAESKRKQGGLFGTVFGAIAFSIVSFTCVAPFLGGFAGMASSGQYTQFELLLAGLTFAGAFALPFFVLALFPSLLKQLPKSGGWMDTIKAVMGFLEIAAALKFFRQAEIGWTAQPTYFTYDLVLAGWVVVALVTGLYLLGIFRLPHDEDRPNLAVPRLVFSLLFLGFGLYLVPGLFKNSEGRAQRPGGIVFAWVDGFLLPETTAGSGEFPWSADLPDAIDRARADKRLVFVDFTGKTCSNCKLNEQQIFPKFRKLFDRYELVSLYTDVVPAEFYINPPGNAECDDEAKKVNLVFQDRTFGTTQLPLYAIFEPTPTGARVVAVYAEGKINDAKGFEEFLQGPLK